MFLIPSCKSLKLRTEPYCSAKLSSTTSGGKTDSVSPSGTVSMTISSKTGFGVAKKVILTPKGVSSGTTRTLLKNPVA